MVEEWWYAAVQGASEVSELHATTEGARGGGGGRRRRIGDSESDEVMKGARAHRRGG